MRYLCIAVCRRGNERVLKRNKLNQMKRRGEWSVVVFFGGGRAALCVFGWGQWRCHDSGLPWVKALELGSSEDRAGSDSPSSELPDASGSMVLQLALFRPRWPSIVWESRVSEKRAHSANRGSTTYVMKPGGRERILNDYKRFINMHTHLIYKQLRVKLITYKMFIYKNIFRCCLGDIFTVY